jgi:hypothetical protein
MTCSRHPAGLKNLAQPFIETRSAKDFGEEEECAAGIAILRDGEERAGQLRIRPELIRAGKEPSIDSGVFGAKNGLQFTGKARRVIDKEAGKYAEETREQFAGSIGHVRPRTTFNLREVRLAEATAKFLFHSVDNFGLRHGAA